MKACAILLLAFVSIFAAETPWLRLEDAGEAQTPAAFIYDPLAQRSEKNAASLRVKDGDAPREVQTRWKGGSFTVECYAKPARDFRRDAFALAAGKHRAGCHFLPQWGQTYWGGFSDAVKEGAWTSRHYVTIARLVEGKENNLAWRHLALVYDAEAKTFTTWLDHWQRTTVAAVKAPEWDGVLRVGEAWDGWIDEVRFAPRARRPAEFLRASGEELRGVSFGSKGGRFHPASGVFDARENFGAVGDGKHDDTAALARALRDTPPDATVYLPAGTYLVSDTIGFRQFRIMAGESREKTIIKLKDNAPGFTDAQKPKPVVRCLFNNNQSIANYIEHLTIDTGRGNAGAVALRYNAHNQGWCDSLTLRSGDGAVSRASRGTRGNKIGNATRRRKFCCVSPFLSTMRGLGMV